MLRYLAGVASALLLVAAGVFLFRSTAATEALKPARQAAVGTVAGDDAQTDDALPAASARSREEKRFDRLDKDRNGGIAREEFFAMRRKAFARLDVNGDGKLSFEEWATKATAKFAAADRDKSGVLDRTEFASTAVVRKARPRVPCPQPPQPDAAE